MCRFLVYSGPSTTIQKWLLDSTNSLITQSRYSKLRNEPMNEDGFGLGWYPEHDDPFPGTFVSIEPAWSNRNLHQLAGKIKSPLFFAHIRDASKGMPVSAANCHPFQFGPYLWMHNGFFQDFASKRRQLLQSLSDQAFDQIKGNTDSEHAFAMLLDNINFNENADNNELINAMEQTIQQLKLLMNDSGTKAEAHMNFALTNGKTSLFSRFNTDRYSGSPPSLFYLEGKGENGEYILIASEPVTNEEGWHAVNEDCMLVVENHKLDSIRKLEFN